MVIEILYPEVCNLYGDSGNILVIEKNLSSHNIIKTTLLDEPYFVKHKVDFVYLGSMTPSIEKKVMEKLLPYKDIIKKMIDDGVMFLFTGNALEIMGKSVTFDDGTTTLGLGIFDITSKVDENNRYHSLFLGTYDGLDKDIVGYKCQSSVSSIGNDSLFKVTKELNNASCEGIHVNNFYGTNLLGPILVLNPFFTKQLFAKLGYDGKLFAEDEMIDAYNKRYNELSNENIKL